MRRLYLELAVPDELAEGAGPVGIAELVELLLDDAVNIKRARWYPMGYDVPNALTHIGWLNPSSGVLHRNKFGLHPGRDWARVFLYDPAQFAQVDGGEHCATLAEAMAKAEHKVSFNLHTGERVRLVLEPVDCGGSLAFVYRPFATDLREALAERGYDVAALAAKEDDD